MVRECAAEVVALLVAEGREVWVWQFFVFGAEVVVALGVAHEMDRGSHCCFVCGFCSLVYMRDICVLDDFLKAQKQREAI